MGGDNVKEERDAVASAEGLQQVETDGLTNDEPQAIQASQQAARLYNNQESDAMTKLSAAATEAGNSHQKGATTHDAKHHGRTDSLLKTNRRSSRFREQKNQERPPDQADLTKPNRNSAHPDRSLEKEKPSSIADHDDLGMQKRNTARSDRFRERKKTSTVPPQRLTTNEGKRNKSPNIGTRETSTEEEQTENEEKRAIMPSPKLQSRKTDSIRKLTVNISETWETQIEAGPDDHVASLASALHNGDHVAVIDDNHDAIDRDGAPPTTNLRIGQRVGPRTIRHIGAIRVTGMDATSEAFSDLPPDFSQDVYPEVLPAGIDQSDENELRDGLVEARLVHEQQLINAEALDVARIKKIATLAASVVILAGLTVGIGVGLSLGSDQAPPVIINNTTAPDFFAIDFADFTVPSSSCFETTQELYRVVDDYAHLLASTAGLSKTEYLDVRNQSLTARDAISGIFGWPIGEFCVSRITSLDLVFSPDRSGPALSRLNEDVSQWDVSRVVSLDHAFARSGSFNQALNAWNTSRVTNMAHAFDGCSVFDQNLSAWDVSQVVSMEGMFQQAETFNQAIGKWNTSRVSTMENMFFGAASFNSEISDWDVSRVKNLEKMFEVAPSFNQDLSRWELHEATSMRRMFWRASSFNQPSTCEWGFTFASNHSVDAWFDAFFRTMCEKQGLQAATQLQYEWPMVSLCADCQSYFNEKFRLPRDIGKRAPTTAVKSTAALRRAVDQYMTYRVGRAQDPLAIQTSLAGTYGWPIGEWNVSLIDDFSHVFSVHRLKPLAVFNDDISKWDVSNGKSFAWMFAGCALFNQDLAKWEMSKATNLSGMFGRERAAENLLGGFGLPGAASFDQDISWWNVSRVTRMDYMFQGAKSFNQDLIRWDVSKVETMESMFMLAQAFSGDLPWNVSKVRHFNLTFYNASRFNGDITTWDTSSVRTLRSMFSSAIAFDRDLSGWNVTSVTSMADMFHKSRFSKDISNWEPHSCMDFRFMFWSSTLFNHSLCEWGQWIDRLGVRVSGMFAASGCLKRGDPVVVGSAVSPLCTSCPEGHNTK